MKDEVVWGRKKRVLSNLSELGGWVCITLFNQSDLVYFLFSLPQVQVVLGEISTRGLGGT